MENETKDATEVVAVSAKARLAATEKLDGKNYPTWRVALRQILQSEGLSFVFDDREQQSDDATKVARAKLIMNQTVAVRAHNRRIQYENISGSILTLKQTWKYYEKIFLDLSTAAQAGPHTANAWMKPLSECSTLTDNA